jgi:hypothetical protein
MLFFNIAATICVTNPLGPFLQGQSFCSIKRLATSSIRIASNSILDPAGTAFNLFLNSGATCQESQLRFLQLSEDGLLPADVDDDDDDDESSSLCISLGKPTHRGQSIQHLQHGDSDPSIFTGSVWHE